MRAVIQRVSRARVLVEDRVVGEIGPGLVALVGVAVDDAPSDATWMADKLAHLRIFSDDQGKMNRSVLDTGGAVLVVSQFTLLGDARKGRRPSFVQAAAGPGAEALYRSVAERLRDLGLTTATGSFGADMQVELANDGPVTLLLDSARAF